MGEKKKVSGLKWLVGGVAVGAAVFLGFHFVHMNGMDLGMGFEQHGNMQAMMQGKMQQGAVDFAQQAGHGGMRHGHGGGHGGMMGMHDQGAMMGRGHGGAHHGFGGWFGFGMFGFLFAIASLVLGWYLRKTREKKWLGNVFIALGLLPVWPVALAGLAIYWIAKKIRTSSPSTVTEPSAVETYTTDVTDNAKFLDEWEQAAKKEEN